MSKTNCKWMALVLATLGAVCVSYGQQPEAPPKAVAPAAPAQAPAQPSASDAAALDYLYNRKPQEGTAAAAAAEDKLRADDKMRALDALAGAESPLGPDFEQYLNSAEADPAKLKAYLANYNQIIALLLQRKTQDAYQLLFAMASYEGDAGISRQLANRVQTVWAADANTRSILAEDENLKEQVRKADWNVDQYAESGGKKLAAPSSRHSNSNNSNANAAKGAANGATESDGGAAAASAATEAAIEAASDMGSSMAGKMRVTDEYLQSLDGKARLKFNDIRMKSINEKAKSEFADYISTLYSSGRLLHVVAAADFYRALFEDGDLPAAVANKADAASEIVRKVTQAVDVVRFKIGAGELSSASAILREAFKLDPEHPSLQGLERPLKLKVAVYYDQLKKMQNLVEAREFGGLETLIANTQKMATDFDAIKAQALVNAVKLDSKMHLGEAKIAAEQGDQQRALDEFKAAATAWPGNPDLDVASASYFASQDSKNKGVAEFDRDIEEGNYRAVYDNQLPLLASIKGDPTREKKFKDAMERVSGAEVAAGKADLLARNGDSCGAWEALEAASAAWPDDGKLNRMRAEMAIKAAEFVSAVSKAQEAETRKEYGFSLTLYVEAQRRYPASQIANEAITRLSAQILGNKPLAQNP